MFIDLFIRSDTVLQQCHLLSYAGWKKRNQTQGCFQLADAFVLAAVSLVWKNGKLLQMYP